ncbi:hypothetical protein COCON_G00215290 [Conger conger]|uniref:Uncharacterized protein n=1 Tax=Conger conger TaxID=82655 RepID=A0A9Q1CX39_CONCO|nr:hypothetical protein COCON_G00215290 [Conger conger]
MESVHMAELETQCTTPELNTLESECVTAHSGVGGGYHTDTPLIKTETDLGPTDTGYFKTESLDSTDLGCVTHLHPDQIKAEPDYGGYIQAQHISDLQDTWVHIKSDDLKFESSESLVSGPMGTVMDGATVNHRGQTEPWKHTGEPNSNCKNKGVCVKMASAHTFENPQPSRPKWEWKCCDPLRRHRKPAKKSLRPTTVNAAHKYSNVMHLKVSPGNKLCPSCIIILHRKCKGNPSPDPDPDHAEKEMEAERLQSR